MNRKILEDIITIWKEDIPNRKYDKLCNYWDEIGEFTVYRAAGNPNKWGNKIVEIGPLGAKKLFKDFHDNCETYTYDVSGIIIDEKNKRAAWQVEFMGKRKKEDIKQELAFIIHLNDKNKISKAFIWPGNP